MAKKVDNRNLVVVDTFDRFADKVGKLDFEVEDLVALVTSLANTFYWLNVESVWGPIGFTWSKVDNYGVFNKTTVPFTIIPKLPDGHRIKQFDNTFNNISSNYIEVQKSDWSNFTTIGDLCPDGKEMKIDLSEANITTGIKDKYMVRGNGKLYIKADLSHINENTSILYNIMNNFGESPYGGTNSLLIMDDNNKYLNIPINHGVGKCSGLVHWKGTGPYKTEYLFSGINARPAITSNNVVIRSDSLEYELVNMNSLGHKSEAIYKSVWDGWETNSFPPIDNIPISTVIIDTSVDKTICMLHMMDISDRNWFERRPKYLLNPIQFKGEVDAVDWVNPYCVINGEWPQYPKELVEQKMRDLYDTNGNLVSDTKFMYSPTIVNGSTCPYTIDCTNIENLSVFENAIFYNEQIPSNEEILEKYNGYMIGNIAVAKVLPTFTNLHPFRRFTVFGRNQSPHILCELSQSIDCDSCYYQGIYIPEGVTLTTGSTPGWNSHPSGISDYETVHIILRPDPANNSITTSTFGFFSNYNMHIGRESDIINYYTIPEEYRTDEILQNSTIPLRFIGVKGGKNSYYRCPLICVTKGIGLETATLDPIVFIESDFIYIYKAHVTLTNYNSQRDDPNMDRIMADLRKVIAGTKPCPDNPNGPQPNFTLKSVYYNQLTDEEKNHIINDLNYVLVNQI